MIHMRIAHDVKSRDSRVNRKKCTLFHVCAFISQKTEISKSYLKLNLLIVVVYFVIFIRYEYEITCKRG